MGPLFTSVLVRLIGPMYVVPTGPPSHLPRLRFPHPRYRIIFIEGPKSRGRNLKGLRPEPIAQALHSAHTERRSESWAPHDVGSGQAHRPLYRVPTGRPSNFPRIRGTASFREKVEKLRLNPSHVGSALGPTQNAGPHLDRNGQGSQYDRGNRRIPEDVQESQDDREAGP